MGGYFVFSRGSTGNYLCEIGTSVLEREEEGGISWREGSSKSAPPVAGRNGFDRYDG